MIESIGSLGDYPLGFGHKRYWQTTGSTETEFLHMAEVVANGVNEKRFFRQQ